VFYKIVFIFLLEHVPHEFGHATWKKFLQTCNKVVKLTVKQNGCSEQECVSATLKYIDYRFKKSFDYLKEILKTIPRPDVKNMTTKYKIIGKISRLIL
jgi:hypothetical protein